MSRVVTSSGRFAIIDWVGGKYEDDIEFDAHYEDNGEDVNDVDHELIREEYAQLLWEEWHQNKIAEAEHLMDAELDRLDF